MRKQDLRNGMIVRLKGFNNLGLILRGNIFSLFNNEEKYRFEELEKYNDNMEHYSDEKLNIIAIYESKAPNILEVFRREEINHLNLIWEQKKEVDWSKVPSGTKVKCWDHDDRKYEGIFLEYRKTEDIYPFHVFVPGDDEIIWRSCELDSEKNEEHDLEEEWLKCDGYDFYKWLFENFYVIRKQA